LVRCLSYHQASLFAWVLHSCLPACTLIITSI
jgi:hypothetical protein